MADSPEPPPEDDALASLRKRVDEAQRRAAPSSNQPPENAASLAFKFGGEFGAAVLVGAAIGFGIDYWVHTSPWGLMIGVGIGFCAGVLNVVRTAQAYQNQNPVNPNSPVIPDDDD
jgi:ATP synthase protein I